MTTKTPGFEPTPSHASIRMGEMSVGRGEESLRTLLGSCIGLALYCRRSLIGGLAHIVLPESRGKQGTPAKYVDTAIPELIRRIELAGGRGGNLKAKIAGGANMLASQAVSTIGDQNLETIQRLLRKLEIPIVAEHCGGVSGRRMTFYLNTGRVTIEVVGGDSVDI